MHILLAQINPIVGDIKGNLQKVLNSIHYARSIDVKLVVFPELVLTGYPPEDFLLLPHFIIDVEIALNEVLKGTKGISVVMGVVRKNSSGIGKPLYNSAAIIEDGVLVGFYDKMLLPTYDVFDERRFFEPGQDTTLWNICGKRVGITICEDIWQHSEQLRHISYSCDPVKKLSYSNPDFVINISASPYSLNKFSHRVNAGKRAALTLRCPLLLCNQVGGNDSLIFDGYSFYIDQSGALHDYARGFKEDFFLIDLDKKKSERVVLPDIWDDLYLALVLGIRDYFHKSGFTRACLGVSGGIDSAVVACLAVDALGKDHVLGLMMPSRYSSEGSLSDSKQLAHELGIRLDELSIEKPFESYLELLSPYLLNDIHGITEENIQARIRGMILMAVSNAQGYIVLSTGNKSELAMGYSTLYGDMCGGLGVINDLTKTQVYALANFINRDKERIPKNIILKPPSAELRLNQKDSDSLPDYAIIDNVLQAYVEEHQSPLLISRRFGYPLSIINDLILRIHRNEYKRRQNPPGLRVSEKAFSIGRRFPIVQGYCFGSP